MAQATTQAHRAITFVRSGVGYVATARRLGERTPIGYAMSRLPGDRGRAGFSRSLGRSRQFDQLRDGNLQRSQQLPAARRHCRFDPSRAYIADSKRIRYANRLDRDRCGQSATSSSSIVRIGRDRLFDGYWYVGHANVPSTVVQGIPTTSLVLPDSTPAVGTSPVTTTKSVLIQNLSPPSEPPDMRPVACWELACQPSRFLATDGPAYSGTSFGGSLISAEVGHSGDDGHPNYVEEATGQVANAGRIHIDHELRCAVSFLGLGCRTTRRVGFRSGPHTRRRRGSPDVRGGTSQ
jgi:hypothetical protein